MLLDGELLMVEQVDLDQVQPSQEEVVIFQDQVRIVRDIMVEQD